MKELFCPNCNSKHVIKKGIRKNVLQETQLYHCKQCSKTFSPQLIKKVKYPPKIILKAISFYNRGYTQKAVSKEIAKRYHIKIPQTTISEWINRFKDSCRFIRLREQAVKMYKPEEMIFTVSLQHSQIYKYQLHRTKLELVKSELPEQKFFLLKAYLEKITTEKFPHHIFQPKREELNELTRSSQIKFDILKFIKLEKQNLANKLAELGLMLAKTNKERHQAVQNFMLINDSVTIATEVPVYLTQDDISYFKSKGFTFGFENYRTPITGHIDILQIRNGLIHILDYKPEAEKINAVNQLAIYALALASRTKLAVKDFKCAWFDDKHYYEFFPLHAVYSHKFKFK
jgi:transposase-like protein